MRMVDWPRSIGYASMSLPTGPNVYRSGVNETTAGGQKAYAGVGSRLRWSVTFGRCQRRNARELEGALDNAGNGAEIIRMPWLHGDRLTLDEAGATPVVWDDVEWSEGGTWGPSYPLVTPAVFHPKGATIVQLTSEAWGHDLGIGSWIGFTGVFAAHRIREVLAPGVYRVGPRLRAPVAASEQRCTLEPVVACTVVPGSVELERDPTTLSGSASFVEVLHSEVETYAT